MPQEAGIRARPEEGSLLERGAPSVLVRLGVRGEPEGGWAMFPFPGKKKNNPFHRAKNRAESQPGLWPGRRGRCSFLEQRSSFRPGPVAGVKEKEAVLAQGCQHQLT